MPARLGLRRTGRTHYRPKVSLTSGAPCSALGLKACPAALKPRPGAAHSGPEVRTARPPRPSTGNHCRQTANFRHRPSGLSASYVPKPHRLAAKRGSARPLQKPADRRTEAQKHPGRKQPRAQTQLRSVRGWHEGPADATLLVNCEAGRLPCLRLQTQEPLYSIPHQQRRLPYKGTPGRWRKSNITASCVLPPVVPGTFTAKLAPAPLLAGAARTQLQCPRQALLHPSRQPLTPLN